MANVTNSYASGIVRAIDHAVRYEIHQRAMQQFDVVMEQQAQDIRQQFHDRMNEILKEVTVESLRHRHDVMSLAHDIFVHININPQPGESPIREDKEKL